MSLFASILVFCTLLFVILYSWQLIRWRKGMKKVFSELTPSPRNDKDEGLSIIIPVRNEMGRWELLFDDLKDQVKKGQRELIFVDDRSEDGSGEAISMAIEEKGVGRLLQLSGNESGKKEALAKGIRDASYERILTLDADVRVEDGFLDRLDERSQNEDTDLFLLPVLPHLPTGPWQHVVYFEALALLGVLIGSVGTGAPVLANGGGMLFRKSSYLELGGYERHLHIDSGDDIFLLQDLVEKGKKVKVLSDRPLFIRTRYPETFSEWVSQRLRWASKVKAYRDMGAIASFGLIAGTNCLLILSLFMLLHQPLFLLVLLISWGVKGGMDRIFLILPAQRSGKAFSWKFFPLALLLYPFQLSSLALLRMVWKPEWKGRKISDH